MEDVSVSKGVFAHKGNYKILSSAKKRNSLPDLDRNEPWYRAYAKVWTTIKNCAEEINTSMFRQILADITKYIVDIQENSATSFLNEIPTAILLTGVNLPDHEELFRKLTGRISEISRHIAVLQSRDSGSIKSLTEDLVFQIINGSDEDAKVKKGQCSLRVLETWYRENSRDNPVVVVIPDFESFNPVILRDFILVLSSYRRTMKLVIIFGVATTLHAVHRSLPYDATSKLRVQVFYTPTQVKSLSDILEGTVLSGKTPFMLTGRAFQLLTDIFLFYDFSVDSFLQGYKVCMIQHFFGNNLTSLCCEREEIEDKVDELSSEDLADARNLPSVVKYMEKYKIKGEKEEMEDEDFKWLLGKLLKQFHESTSGFFIILKCLHYLVCSLPGSPLGKQLREIYATVVTCDLADTQEYKECIKLLNFLSKSELVLKLENLIKIIEESATDADEFTRVVENLKCHLQIIKEASLEISLETTETSIPTSKISRTSFRENLLTKAQKSSKSAFKHAQVDLMNYLNDLFIKYLKNPNRLPCSEIFCFSDANAGKHHLRGSLRAAIHTGLNDPSIYLNCGCCKFETEQTILPTLPDLTIIYKLHLESRKLINMYDWLQAFLMIINPNTESEQTEVDPKVQARFTRAVAELQFLGFIKTSRKKTDHVKRLT